jgi:hypothetical protein
MNELTYTLITDGSSDRALEPILTWLLRQFLKENVAIQSEWADLRRVPNPPKKLHDKIVVALDMYSPCNILFVHRDAEKDPLEKRVQEIRVAERIVASSKKATISLPPIVCVIPISMIESWLLFDEAAIREAIGNSNGKQELNLPKLAEIERIADSKARLHESFRKADFPSRRGKKSNIPSNARLADRIDNFAPLRNLSAFQELEKELKITLNECFPDLLI